LCSGAAALIYQVVWFRMLHRAFGGTAPAAATVLAVFMAGLGAGAYLAGRRVDRVDPRACVVLYVALELAAAAYAVTTPWLMNSLPDLHAWAVSVAGLNPATKAFARTLGSACVLLPPTALMGATLPVLLRAARPADADLTRSVAVMYAANNAGAVIGALSSGFLLLGTLGETRTVLVAASLNVAAAAAAAVVLRGPSPAAQPSVSSEPARERAASTPLQLLLASAAAGFVALGYEVIWTRTLVPLMGSTAYAFASMLASVLLGLALGSILAARSRSSGRELRRGFGLLVSASAMSALLSIRYAADLVIPTLKLVELSDGFVWRFCIVPLLISSTLVLGPMVLSGMALPLGIRCVAQHQGAGAATGTMYAANTAGSIVGALVVGIVLVPLLGTNHAAALVSSIGVVLGASAALTSLDDPRRRLLVLAPVGAVALLAATQPPLAVELFAGGIHMASASERRLIMKYGGDIRTAGSQLLYVGEGQQTTVLVERRWGRRAFFVDGKPEATDGLLDMRNQYLLAHIPGLLHPRPERALVVGLGTGMTAGALTLHANVDIAELNEVVPNVARVFSDLNHGVVDSDRANIVIEDGRVFLNAHDQHYDIISVDPIHPYVAGASTLYTRNYFEAVRRRLRPGGIASHWLPLYQLGWYDVQGVVKSFADVFPDVVVFITGRDAILVGNAGAAPITPQRLRGYDRPRVRDDLARVLIDSPTQLAAMAILGPAEVAAVIDGARAITDDDTWIEFTSPAWFQHPTLFNLINLVEHRRPMWPGATEAEQTAYRTYGAILADTIADSTHSASAALELALRNDPASRELRIRRDIRAGAHAAGFGF
jgi:spermidine synthase